MFSDTQVRVGFARPKPDLVKAGRPPSDRGTPQIPFRPLGGRGPRTICRPSLNSGGLPCPIRAPTRWLLSYEVAGRLQPPDEVWRPAPDLPWGLGCRRGRLPETLPREAVLREREPFTSKRDAITLQREPLMLQREPLTRKREAFALDPESFALDPRTISLA